MIRAHARGGCVPVWRACLWRVGLAVIAGAVAWGGLRPSCGQVVVQAIDLVAPSISDESDPNAPDRAFILPAQPAEVTEAMEDYQRHVKRGAWEKAFKSLEKVTSSSAKGLLARGDQVMVPGQVLLRQSLAALPPEGKQAYRLFHDAEARRLLEQAQGKDEAERLGQIVSAHLITSVGDQAANRLGDLYFEQGAMDRAIESWQLILHYLPESTIPRAELLAKTGIALARSQRWSEWQAVRRELTEKHAGEGVTLGGQRKAASEIVAAVGAGSGELPGDEQAADFALPGSDEPLWQFPFWPAGPGESANQGRGIGWDGDYSKLMLAEMVPPVVADEKRVYCTIMGCDLALDLMTGKLLWRSGRPHEVKEKSKQNAYLFPERYSVTVQGDRVWSVGRSFDQLGQHGAVFALVGRDKATGKELFNSKNTGAVKEWSLRSSPVFAGDLVYCAASKANEGNQVRVLAFSPKDGKVAWNVQLGTTKFDPDQMYYQRTVHPTLVLREDRLYVDTHCGALLELDAQSGEIRWAVAYDSETPDQNRWWGYRVNNGFVTVGRPLFVEGALYFKGMLSDELLAVQPTGPVVAFRRPVSQTAVLVGVDADRFYTGGDAITAYDLRQRDAKNRPRLAWNRPLPTGTGWVRPLITRSKIYQFTPRGIFEVEKATGDARVFRGADIESLGGALVLAPGVLLTASNGAITAYPILPASPPETAPPATAANP